MEGDQGHAHQFDVPVDPQEDLEEEQVILHMESKQNNPIRFFGNMYIVHTSIHAKKNFNLFQHEQNAEARHHQNQSLQHAEGGIHQPPQDHLHHLTKKIDHSLAFLMNAVEFF